MFENITNFFKKIGKKEEKKQSQENSRNAAKERLHLVLMQDRANVSADFLELMKQEIIEVIKKYIEIDEKEIDVRLTNKENEDGTNGAPALYANIPILNIKSDSRKINKKDIESKQEEKEEKKVNNIEEKTENKKDIETKEKEDAKKVKLQDKSQKEEKKKVEKQNESQEEEKSKIEKQNENEKEEIEENGKITDEKEIEPELEKDKEKDKVKVKSK